MIPLEKVKQIVNTYETLEKELASGDIDKKNFAKKSKKYSSIRKVINQTRSYLGFEKALSEAGLALDPELQVSALTADDDGYQAIVQLLSKGKAFDAVFGACDLIAMGAIKALEAKGRHVPNDVSVIGFDDIPAASYINPSLTTIAQNTLQAGELLVENLLKLIEGESIESMLLPAKLVVRDSCCKRA